MNGARMHDRSQKAAAASEIKAAAYTVADVLSLFSAFRQQVRRKHCWQDKAARCVGRPREAGLDLHCMITHSDASGAQSAMCIDMSCKRRPAMRCCSSRTSVPSRCMYAKTGHLHQRCCTACDCLCPTCARCPPSRTRHPSARCATLLLLVTSLMLNTSSESSCCCVDSCSSRAQLPCCAQGGPHPQAAITTFVAGASKRDTYQRLSRTSTNELPSASGRVLVTHEDETGVAAPSSHSAVSGCPAESAWKPCLLLECTTRLSHA